MSGDRAPAPATIPDRFAALARAQPEALALQGERHAFTYGALLAEARSIAGALAAHPDAARVALLGDHDAPIAAAALGTLFAGRAYVPLDPSTRPRASRRSSPTPTSARSSPTLPGARSPRRSPDRSRSPHGAARRRCR